MIEFNHVSKTYHQRKVIDDLNFAVKEGENFILLGTSGCGKTTTLKMINRLVSPDTGTVRLDGEDIAGQHVEQLRRRIGYVLQHSSLFPHYTVAENIAVVPRLLGWAKPKIDERSRQLAAKLRLPESCLPGYPGRLSGGEAQRVNLARALAADPPLLLMDEPFGALDTITRAAIRREFLDLDELKAKTIMMVTHDVQEAFELGDTICLMDAGRVMQTGSPAELLFRPANAFVRDFLSGAYTQLIYTVVHLSDLWSWLQQDSDGQDSGNIFSGKNTVWDAITAVPDKNDRTLRLRIRHEASEKSVSLEGLLTALNHYQKNR
ncbi:ABC transporter ATP-binding protein [Taibaiella koreensis]|uniref:ABC transporter ATP-binding protein n=1 Tax=Taibaiella koreensis TaxID=1268548 RepID=UPI000E59C8C8|nr:ABC transporter ATP-binding protein [Taibaiella koreensis]